MNAIAKRETVESLFARKLHILREAEALEIQDRKLRSIFEPVNGYSPYQLSCRAECTGKDAVEKYTDRTMWRYLVGLYELDKYMLCTEYEKLRSQVESFQTPVFTVESAQGWLDGLKGLIYENVRLMCKKVYEELITRHYYTGGSSYYSSKKKKRNNNGVDTRFILTTYDYDRVFGYWRVKPTITDDLEKVCYILDGEKLPDRTLISQARADGSGELSCPYFSVKFCKNGNTHYCLTEQTRDRLNLIGPDGKIIGEPVKIKILED